MIEIKPTIDYQFNYPGCKDEVTVEQLLFAGMHVLAKCSCSSTGKQFYHTLPTGHATYYPIAFSVDGSDVSYAEEAKVWLAQPLHDSIINQKKITVSVRKETYRSCRSAVLLNCLDNCYGHMLYKLFNAQRHLRHHQPHGLILLIHRSLRWLVPDGVAEVWWVDGPIRQLNQRLEGLDTFVQRELERFDEVYLSAAIMHLDLAEVDIFAFTKVSSFPLTKFTTSPPQITFVCREDRFWLPCRWDFFFYLVAVKFKCLPAIRSYFVRRQGQAIQKTVRLVRRQRADARFFAVGLGRMGRLGHDVVDRRVAGPVSSETERQWAALYATSHIVVGVHGSGMLLPTALAASFVDLVPSYKIRHLGEDIVPRHSPSNMPFLGRFPDASASAKRVSHHITEMLSGFKDHCLKASSRNEAKVNRNYSTDS